MSGHTGIGFGPGETPMTHSKDPQQPQKNMGADGGMQADGAATPSFVAYTPKEGRWPFTLSPTPQGAIAALIYALQRRQALKHPLDNPVSAVLAAPPFGAFLNRKTTRPCR